MKAWVLKDFGLKNLKLENVPTPKPGPGELLVKIGAVSLNYRDKAIIEGFYEADKVHFPLIPVSDAAGIIVATGAGVTRFKTGDRVNSHLYSHWIDGAPAADEPDWCLGMPLPGGLAEYMILDEKAAVKAPAHMSDEQASTLPIAALTAWYALMNTGRLQPGQTVLVQGTGGVAVFATQIAHAYGAHIIATSGKDSNLERIRQLGADAGINYKTQPDWEQRVLALTHGKGADITLETAGGNGINQSIAATKIAGTIAQIGFLTGQTAQLNLMPLIFRQTRIHGIAVAPRTAFDAMNPFLERHKILPEIDHIYRFDEAIEAFHHLSRGAFGKIIIKIST
ncbi:MAG: NAD(P)-dependent alcohol dehydrogenase [Candidatus Tokpelaia sp.]|uniref:zinc-dependent alcohol dehydrogenase family protein n=1 Tax=Candidatus Tokpelaia sp. TaxID=2233777 RepID=UPI001238DD95|nr:NAD(P)-dependent alcohol dehydrogenase [Candidatus Tokpelaia sp.]KAA6204858.1 MAG: NAD(P)-dependent alcohol dehydrogenase [Candidatus Tokpelaia sp.]KAA6207567.1 MAG: NAD(P)-dependent alcohol dehydrogenase [Candidatus Tokpelaia sp.]KAA6404736.1 NAD(P)-dependent alcohol dehydrogenase [Candidatus Tokpelaia sp.]